MGYPVRPSGYVGWGSTGMTNVAEPTDAKKGLGWSVNEQPPSSYFNWIQSKQDEWVQYLDWRGQLTSVVSDDFVYPIGATSWYQDWVNTGAINSPPNDFFWRRNQTGMAPSGCMPMGVVSARGGIGGIAQLNKEIDYYNGQDFRMEVIFRDWFRGGASAAFELGMFNTTGASMVSPAVGFAWTGASGTVMFSCYPSGQNPTSVSLGFNSATGAGFHKYVVENRSPTMAIYIDDRLQAAMPSVNAVRIPTGVGFGVRVWNVSGEVFVASVDKLELLVRR